MPLVARQRRWWVGLWLIVALLSLVLSGCGGGGKSSPSAKRPVDSLLRIEVTPSIPTLAKGTVLTLAATGIYSSGAVRDLSTTASWSSDAESIATVDAAGQVTALTQGSAILSATLQGVTGGTALAVTDATLTRLEINPVNPRLPKGAQLMLTALGHYSDSSSQDLTQQATWSLDDGVATVADSGGDKGLLSALLAGSATVSVGMGGVRANTAVTVSDAVLTAIAIEPASPSLPLGTGMQLSAMGYYSDGSTQDLTSQAAWSSADTGVATVANGGGTKGTVATVAVGSTGVNAVFAGLSAGATLTVRAAVLEGIAVSAAVATLPSGYTQALTALGHYSDGTAQDITSQVAWESSSPTVLAVSNAAGSQGLATALGVGNVSVFATLEGVSGSTSLAVTHAVLTAIDIEPRRPHLALDTQLALRAIGRYSDGSIQELTARVSWFSDAEATASISNGEGTEGLVQGKAAGAATVTAALDGVSGTAALTVTDAQLRAINLVPAEIVLAKGTNLALVAVGDFSDGSTQDLTGQVAWKSSRPDIAAVSGTGVLEALVEGGGRVTASHGGISGSVPVTVTGASLTDVEITPSTLTLAVNTEATLTATAVFDDGSRQDVTGQAVWSTADHGVAQVGNGEGLEGRVSATAAGNTSVSASFGGMQATTALTVTTATLSVLRIEPSTASLDSGVSIGLVAMGDFSDGTSQDLTAQVVWSSSDPALAQVSNARETRGRVTAGVGAGGSVTITAALWGESAVHNLNVNYQPQRPVSLVVLATPNVVHSDISDLVTLSVRVQAADPSQVVADGTLIDILVSSNGQDLQSQSVVTTNGTAGWSFTTTTAGLLIVQATQPDTVESNATVVHATTTPAEVITPAAFVDAQASGNVVLAGGRFGFFIFNTSNRTFPLDRFEFCNGPGDPLDTSPCNGADVVDATSDSADLNGNLLEGGVGASAIVTLEHDVTDQGLRAKFFLRDPVTDQPFAYGVTYTQAP